MALMKRQSTRQIEPYARFVEQRTGLPVTLRRLFVPE